MLFDEIVNLFGKKPDRHLTYHMLHMLHDTLHEERVNKDLLLLIIQKQNKMSKDYDDLKFSMDAAKQDLTDIKTKVGTVIDKLKSIPGGLTAEEKALLIDELTDNHTTATQVETNLDAAIAVSTTGGGDTGTGTGDGTGTGTGDQTGTGSGEGDGTGTGTGVGETGSEGTDQPVV